MRTGWKRLRRWSLWLPGLFPHHRGTVTPQGLRPSGEGRQPKTWSPGADILPFALSLSEMKMDTILSVLMREDCLQGTRWAEQVSLCCGPWPSPG